MQLDAKSLCMQIVIGDKICPSSSYSLKKLLHLCAKDWMNRRTLQPISSSSWCVSHVLESVHHWLVTYWDLCIERRDCYYNTRSPIGYWGKGSIVGWYQVLRFLLLVIACFNNSGFQRIVTLNSPGGVLPQWFSQFINKSPVSNLFSAALSIINDLFVTPRFAC